MPLNSAKSAATSNAARARFWRGLDELEGRTIEDAQSASEPILWQRREFMKLMGASLALAGSACSRTPLATYGKPVFYASAIARDGYGAGVLVETNMGRPTKIEGNPLHPASLGATDIFAQAAVLELWDPDRSKTVLHDRSIATWERFLVDLQSRLRASADGEGVAILTETVTSPTLHAQLRAVLARYPRAHWHHYQPLNRDNVYDGSALAFGERLEPRYRFGAARIVVAFDADFAGSMPGCVRYARDFADARRMGHASRMNRLYDHRRAIRTSDIAGIVDALAGRVGGVLDAGRAPVTADPWLDVVAADLLRHPGASIVVAGDRQPPSVHARVHAINEALGNLGKTVELPTPVAFGTDGQLVSLQALAAAMATGKVESLLILGGNPVYNAPADLGFADALARVAWKAHLSVYDDETSLRCTWHITAAHVLETWGDIRAFDGTVTIQQPCIAPLYDGRSAHEVLSAVADGLARPAHDVVREFWQATRNRADFEAVWHDALRRGVMEAEASLHTPKVRRSFTVPTPTPGTGVELVFAADPTVGDGRHANNAWLQELPKPLTTLTWDNAALLSPALAERLQIANEDVIDIAVDRRSIKLPVWIVPGHADRSLTVYLGNGRSRAGTVGSGIGVDAYALRTSAHFWTAEGAAVTRTGTRYALATTQQHNRMEGRDLVRTITRDQAARCEESACVPAHEGDRRPSLYPDFAYDDYKWGMSVDLSSCIGCAACTIACQAENNIPVVGKKEVRRGRAMHWIRVDRYYAGDRDKPRTVFQPVPCMQCEHAPCEEVCPVEASVHDAEGLNVQVYNRCIGTRFCSNNCPYKVRRFNFFHYARDEPALDAQRNPEVTVRMRGVMEKCTYCVQRIATARILADRENRRIADGEVVTACQAVCPTRAIVFGDLNDPASEVSKRKASPFDYALLAELNTRPRTTYLPKITNEIPGLEAT
ncbi:MAG: hypothetical protein AUH79_07660 [Betaproteobacteria bacterium 13_1_40CM_4_64_4]|nr:MAG: hypothetical protein AUH79_07660 [Betaproteobacteria bacterium 13_1_40CM_4_64_4]